jgi:dTDP-4-amino-4,6-dideoxygalactose transaminase
LRSSIVAPLDVPFLDLTPAYRELEAELDDAYRRVMASGRYILGEELEAFESEFAAYCGTRHCIGVGNGLDALRLMLRAADVGAGDDVLVPANTYIATWLAVSHAGATPVPVEPDPATFNLDPARLDAALTPRTRAILAVHLYGLPADMKAIGAFAARHGLLVFEDAAQAHGACCYGTRAGALSLAAGFSFYPTKNLGAFGDGGAVTTNDDALAARMRMLRNYGSTVRYRNETIGWNSRLDPLHAAMLRVRLTHLDEWNGRRCALAALYVETLRDVEDGALPVVPDWAQPVWHQFVVRHARRDALREHLAACRIGSDIHYPIPPHRSQAYADLALDRGALPITERLVETVVSLPMNPHLTREQAEAVCRAVRSFGSTG